MTADPPSRPWTPDPAALAPVTDAELGAAFARPQLLVVIDTEEEFDWDKPLSRDNRGVSNIASQAAAQRIFAEFGVVPTYVIDHPVAQDPTAAAVFRDYVARGEAEVGAHLHPWVNPPDEETVTPFNSYPGNLPADLERAKLARLTETIEQNIGVQPRVYKAGRYGFGPNTLESLAAFGFTVDCSMVARTSFTADGGPDYRGVGHNPAWLGPARSILELPLTAGFAGLARRAGPRLFARLAGPTACRFRLPGILARSGLLERIRLSPEGAELADLQRLTRALLADGCRVFSLAYHSPSLQPGLSPYVRSQVDLEDFLARLRGYIRFFTRELGGEPTTPEAIRQRLAPASQDAAQPTAAEVGDRQAAPAGLGSTVGSA